MRRLLAAVVVAWALVAPAAGALAQGSPFTPLPPDATPPPAPAPAPAPSTPTGGGSSSDGGGLTNRQTTLIYVAAIVVLGGIGLMIMLDAREKARRLRSRGVPEPDRAARDPHRERTKQQLRRKQKAARAQRKRNR